MKKMFVRAYCQSNLGDDLFVLHLAKEYPQTQFYLYAVGGNQRAFANTANLCLPSAWDRLRRKGIHLLRGQDRFDGSHLDGTVVIGGSILWEGAPLDFGQPKKPCFLIGPNCESAYSPEFRGRLETALSCVTGCCFRDSASYMQFSKLSNVTWAPDVLFDYEPGLPKVTGQGIGISVVSGKGAFRNDALREGYFASIARLCMLCQEQKIPVRLLSFCAGEGDEEAIAKILDRVPRPEGIQASFYRGDPQALLAEMNACQSIVATRFHAMILGWVLGKNVVPIIYSTKQTQVLADCGFCGPMWNALEDQNMTGEELLEAVQAEQGRLDISDLKDRSKAQFSALDRFLQE